MHLISGQSGIGAEVIAPDIPESNSNVDDI